jgi:hypothetical protein
MTRIIFIDMVEKLLRNACALNRTAGASCTPRGPDTDCVVSDGGNRILYTRGSAQHNLLLALFWLVWFFARLQGMVHTLRKLEAFAHRVVAHMI